MLELQLQWSEKEEHPDVKRSGITSGQLAHRDKFGHVRADTPIQFS